MADVEIRTERVDDIPLLIHQQQKMGIPEVLNEMIQPHGNRDGLSVGWLTTVWLSYILSEADHHTRLPSHSFEDSSCLPGGEKWYRK